MLIEEYNKIAEKCVLLTEVLIEREAMFVNFLEYSFQSRTNKDFKIIIVPPATFNIDSERDEDSLDFIKHVLVELVVSYILETEENTLDGLLDDINIYSFKEGHEILSRDETTCLVTMYYNTLKNETFKLFEHTINFFPVGWATETAKKDNFIILYHD